MSNLLLSRKFYPVFLVRKPNDKSDGGNYVEHNVVAKNIFDAACQFKPSHIHLLCGEVYITTPVYNYIATLKENYTVPIFFAYSDNGMVAVLASSLATAVGAIKEVADRKELKISVIEQAPLTEAIVLEGLAYC